MRRLSVTQLLKTSGAFALTSTVATDSVLLLADRLGAVRGGIPGDWYINGPLICWAAVAVPISVHLAGRLISQARGSDPAAIVAGLEGEGPAVRGIPLHVNGSLAGRLFANTIPGLPGGGHQEQAGEVYRPAAWRVTLPAAGPVTIRESELRAFLEAACRRDKHQFSRRYWTEKRRPPMYRAKYDAMMLLLSAAGLIEGRHLDGRASGRLVTHPRHAITFLKHESAYKAA